jgi:RND family efflux transporter MFP subunit
MNFKIHHILPIFLFLLVCCTSSDVQDSNEDNPSEAVTTGKIQSVEVVHPSELSFDAEVLVTGTAMPNQKVTVYAMESGILTSIRKDIGDYVRKGEVIATLANPEIARKVNELQALVNGKQTTYQRLQDIQASTPALTTLQVVETAETEYLTSHAALKGMQDRLNYLTIRAPFNGIITKRMVDKGALIQSGLSQSNPQGIVEIQDINPIRLTVPLAESDIASTSKGMSVKISFPELPGKTFDATVSRTAGVLDPASKTMDIEIDIRNALGKIKPGMYAKVLLLNKSRNGVVSLPITSQLISKNEPYILIVNEDNRVERVVLKKGLANKDFFEVLNAEITKDTKVIVQGKGLVKEGDTVNPVMKDND